MMVPEGSRRDSVDLSAAPGRDEEGLADTHICVASPRYFPDFFGPVVRFSRYAPGLLARGVRLHVLTCKQSPNPGSEYRSAEITPGMGPAAMPVYRCDLSYMKQDGRFWKRWGEALVEHALGTDYPVHVVQLLDVDLRMVPALRILRRANVGVVYTHTMMRSPGGTRVTRWIKDRIWSHTFDAVDRVIVSSSVMMSSVKRRGVRAPVDVIPNGVDLNRFRPVVNTAEKTALRKRLGIDPAGPTVLFIGHLNERKGADLAVATWSIVARENAAAQFVLIAPTRGPKDPDFARTVLDVAQRDGIAHRAQILGPVTNVEDYMRIADVFLFPSRREGMPNVVPEAFASGVATVMTPFLGLPAEFGRPDSEYMLAGHDPEKLSRSVLRLLDEKDLQVRIADAARAWVSEHLSLEASLDAYASLYRTVGLEPSLGTSVARS